MSPLKIALMYPIKLLFLPLYISAYPEDRLSYCFEKVSIAQRRGLYRHPLSWPHPCSYFDAFYS